MPQLFMLSRTGSAETITAHYLFALGTYRALYILNWMYRYYTEEFFDPIVVVAGVVQTVLYADFFYLYVTRGNVLKLSFLINFLSGVFFFYYAQQFSMNLFRFLFVLPRGYSLICCSFRRFRYFFWVSICLIAFLYNSFLFSDSRTQKSGASRLVFRYQGSRLHCLYLLSMDHFVFRNFLECGSMQLQGFNIPVFSLEEFGFN